MWLIKICLLIFFVVILPYLLGALSLSFVQEQDDHNILKDKEKPGIMLITGWFLIFTVFQIVSVPIIIMQKSFSLLVVVYDVALFILTIYAMYKWTRIFKKQIDVFKEWLSHINVSKFNFETVGYMLGCCIAISLLIVQLTATVTLEHYDGDDAYYVAASVATDLYDTMYVRDNYTGYQFTLESRHALSPVPVFVAWLSRMTGIHSTILAHSIIGPYWIALMYLVYWQVAGRLCKEKKQYRPWFMVFLMLWFLFGNVSIYTTETFALTRIWQGKGLVTAIVIPTLFLCLYDIVQNYMEKKRDRNAFFLLVCCVFSAIFSTSTSIFLIPVVLGITGVFCAFNFKRIKCFIEMCGVMLPAIVYGIMYILLK